MNGSARREIYELVYDIVEQIPKGMVATYGQIAEMVPGCTARMVGYALRKTPSSRKLPWQRVVNSAGRISTERDMIGESRQEQLLMSEGVRFTESGRIRFADYRWEGPDWQWLHERRLDGPAPGGGR